MLHKATGTSNSEKLKVNVLAESAEYAEMAETEMADLSDLSEIGGV